MKLNDLTGQKFGRLTVLKTFRENGRTKCECICECGNIKIVLAENLKRGKTKSCGCYNDEARVKNNTKHNLSQTRLYRIFEGMKTRCYNPKCKPYSAYGGRGIIICDEWLNDFINFYNWAIENGYNDALSIDRIDVNGNYEPDNCRWANKKIQSRNRTNNKLYTYKGRTCCIAEWAEIIGINKNVLFNRLKQGWDFKKAILKPVRKLVKNGT